MSLSLILSLNKDAGKSEEKMLKKTENTRAKS